MSKKDTRLCAELYVLLYELILKENDTFDKAVPYVRAALPSARSRTAGYLNGD